MKHETCRCADIGSNPLKNSDSGEGRRASERCRRYGEAGGDGHELHSQSLRWILVGVEQRLPTLSPPRRASARHPALQCCQEMLAGGVECFNALSPVALRGSTTGKGVLEHTACCRHRPVIAGRTGTRCNQPASSQGLSVLGWSRLGSGTG